MDKGAPSSLFVNDGSFMERFKQLQQEKEKDKEREKSTAVEDSKPVKIVTGTSNPKPSVSNTNIQSKINDTRKATAVASGGKLAFSLKQRSKLVAPPVKLGTEEDEDGVDANLDSISASAKRQKLDQKDASHKLSAEADVAPRSPSDPTVKKVAEKLASFVAKHGRQFEHITRQKNPGDTPFKFLFDESCTDYKFYEYKLAEEEKALSLERESQATHDGGAGPSTSKTTGASQRPIQPKSGFQIPASALYEVPEETRSSSRSVQTSGARAGESCAPTGADPIAMMEFYMKKAAKEEKMRRQPKQSKDEMPPPPSLQASGKRGHHMGDYIPQEELEKFLAKCNDAAAQKSTKEAAEKAKIQADNVGHKLLSKMGWREGEGIGGSRKGIADPIMAGDIKTNNLGVGASAPGEVTSEDDIYEQYKKRMMLGYKYRPNPLNNPRKAYY